MTQSWWLGPSTQIHSAWEAVHHLQTQWVSCSSQFPNSVQKVVDQKGEQNSRGSSGFSISQFSLSGGACCLEGGEGLTLPFPCAACPTDFYLLVTLLKYSHFCLQWDLASWDLTAVEGWWQGEKKMWGNNAEKKEEALQLAECRPGREILVQEDGMDSKELAQDWCQRKINCFYAYLRPSCNIRLACHILLAGKRLIFSLSLHPEHLFSSPVAIAAWCITYSSEDNQVASSFNCTAATNSCTNHLAGDAVQWHGLCRSPRGSCQLLCNFLHLTGPWTPNPSLSVFRDVVAFQVLYESLA